VWEGEREREREREKKERKKEGRKERRKEGRQKDRTDKCKSRKLWWHIPVTLGFRRLWWVPSQLVSSKLTWAS
jgi:hypothetical protein